MQTRSTPRDCLAAFTLQVKERYIFLGLSLTWIDVFGNVTTLLFDATDRSNPYKFCFYCSATHVTSQVLQPKLVNKRYRGRHTVISVHRTLCKIVYITENFVLRNFVWVTTWAECCKQKMLIQALQISIVGYSGLILIGFHSPRISIIIKVKVNQIQIKVFQENYTNFSKRKHCY